MSYLEWFDKHAKKHAKIMEKLKEKRTDEILEYFEYDNMKVNEKDFCPLYEKDQKCHDIKELNCYLCGCPNFRFNDVGFKKENYKTLYSYCDIASKDGTRFENEDAIHQNCSGCIVPHKKEYIKKIFNKDWKTIMKETVCGKSI